MILSWDKGKPLKGKLKYVKPTRRLKVMAHNYSRIVYMVTGYPLPDELKLELLLTNHSRKKIKRR